MTDSEIKPIMILAVIQALDSDVVSAELEAAGITYSKLPSVGGFLREKNVTFIIACPHSRQEELHNMLVEAAKKRVTFIASPLESGPLPVPVPVESVVGGVKSFSIELDDYKEF